MFDAANVRLKAGPDPDAGEPWRWTVAGIQEAQEAFRKGFAQLAEAAVPTACPRRTCLSVSRTKPGLARRACSQGSGHGRERARASCGCRYGYVYLFFAACAETGTAVGHVCAKANTVEMSRHLREIGEQVPAGTHALVVLDGAGWHRSRELEIPDNVSLLRLPPCSPELNPVGTLFSALKHRHFANCVFESGEQVRVTLSNRCGTGSPARQERSCR